MTFPLEAQTGGMKHYAQEEKLDAEATYIISQDTRGFIWVGSDNGLFRFDGVEFRHFGRREGLANIEILDPVQLATGEVLALPFGSDVAVLHDGQVRNAGNDPEMAKLRQTPDARFISRVSAGGNRAALFQFQNPDRIFVYSGKKMTVLPLQIQGIDQWSICNYDFADEVTLVSYEQVYKYSISRGQLIPLDMEPGAAPFAQHDSYGNIAGYSSLETGEVVFWRGNEVKVCRISGRTVCAIHRITLPGNIAWAHGQGGLLWVSSLNGGIYAITLDNPDAQPRKVKFMPDHIVNWAFRDRDGNVWFSTKNDGIYLMPKAQFKNYLRSSIGRETGYVASVASVGNDIFLGYGDATVGKYGEGRYTRTKLDPAGRYEIGHILPGTKKVVFGGLMSYFATSCCLESQLLPEVRIVKNISATSPGKGFICTYNGLLKYDETSGMEKCSNDKFYSVAAIDRDSVFAGTFDDIYRMDLRTGHKAAFIRGIFATDIKYAGNGLFVAATNGNGVWIFDKAGVRIKLRAADGLASDKVKNIYIQDSLSVWAATNSGLSRIRLGGTPAVATYTRMDGLPSDRISGCVTRHDSIFVATDKGMAIFAIPELVRQRPYISKNAIVNSAEINGQTFVYPKRLSSLYSDNPIVLNLSLLDYLSFGNVSYRYQVEGLSDQWQTVKSSKIILNALPPGDYSINIFGLAYNGKRSEKMTVLPITIRPLYWQTWWFKSFCILVLLIIANGIAFTLLRRRRHKKMERLLFEKRIAELELQAIKAQINPHFIYNCLNSIQYLVYKKELERAESYIGMFAGMIRNTLHYSEKTVITVSEEAEYLTLYLEMERMRFQQGFSYDICAGPDTDQLKIPSLLVQPFVENALKHGIANLKGREGRILINFETAGDTLRITVSDNGTGLPEVRAKGGGGENYGIRLSRKRLETFRQLFGTEISLEIRDLRKSGGHGTAVILILKPL